MRSRWTLGLAGALIGGVFAFSTLVSAAEKKASEPSKSGTEMKMEKKTEAKPKTKSTTGEVTSADPTMGTLMVKAKDKEMTFTAESKAAKDALAKVKSGDRVTVSYTEQDGKMMAKSVKMAKAAKKAEPKMEMKKETKDTKGKM